MISVSEAGLAASLFDLTGCIDFRAEYCASDGAEQPLAAETIKQIEAVIQEEMTKQSIPGRIRRGGGQWSDSIRERFRHG